MCPGERTFVNFTKQRKIYIEILVPYFKAGLENNEFCMWVKSQPLEADEAKETMGKAVPDIDVYLGKGQIEVIPCNQFYSEEDVFNSERALNSWVEKLNQALPVDTMD